jgi:ribonuclease D
MATDQRAYLIRCNEVGLPGSIVDILQDPEILKVGVAIRDDIKGLQKFTPFEPRGFIELQDYVSQFGIESNGLRGIAAIVLNIKISKSQQLSNWENRKLSDAQVLYAATDAWACYEIYQNLSAEKDD